jgi:uncharacterized membrane protein YhaH (DUF805 family)
VRAHASRMPIFHPALTRHKLACGEPMGRAMSGYGRRMNLAEAVSTVFRNYATFEGRAQRSQYWWWTVFSILVSWATTFIDTMLFASIGFFHIGNEPTFTPVTTLVGLAMIVPSLALSARRFHDLGRTGWWLLIGLTGIGALVIFFWFMVKGDAGPNRFGPDPLGSSDELPFGR